MNFFVFLLVPSIIIGFLIIISHKPPPSLSTQEKMILSRLERRNDQLMDYLKHINDPVMKRLVQKGAPKLTKGSLNKPGYTINKGEIIGICLTDLTGNTNQDQERYLDELYFVVLHELAHVCTPTVGHDASFWENFQKIRLHAVDAGIWGNENVSRDSLVCGESLV